MKKRKETCRKRSDFPKPYYQHLTLILLEKRAHKDLLRSWPTQLVSFGNGVVVRSTNGQYFSLFLPTPLLDFVINESWHQRVTSEKRKNYFVFAKFKKDSLSSNLVAVNTFSKDQTRPHRGQQRLHQAGFGFIPQIHLENILAPQYNFREGSEIGSVREC